MNNRVTLFRKKLSQILTEIEGQTQFLMSAPPSKQSYPEQLAQIREYVDEAGEFSLAYECLVAILETGPFQLSGSSAIRLLEIGLLLKFKTELPEDSEFDSR